MIGWLQLSRIRGLTDEKAYHRVVIVGRVVLGLAFAFSTLAVSPLGMFVTSYGETMQEAAEHSAKYAGGLNADNQEEIYLRHLTKAVNPWGSTPVVCVVSAGFLGVMALLRQIAESLVPSPDVVDEPPVPSLAVVTPIPSTPVRAPTAAPAVVLDDEPVLHADGASKRPLTTYDDPRLRPKRTNGA